jgi:hypothetical protein
MKLFKCSNCGQLIYFENSHCEQCGSKLGFHADDVQLYPLVEQDNSTFTIYNKLDSIHYQYCANHFYKVCNWLVPVNSDSVYCKACSLNRTIPNLNRPEYAARWKKIEKAKHRLVYSLLRLKLPFESKRKNPGKGLWFDFKADENIGRERILTGHDDGLITINLAEADDLEREMTRQAMNEGYRTVLGHFRHEVGHYYWDRLIGETGHLEEFRRLFGDERLDYDAALKRHYSQGPPADWNLQYISAYATMHPWEDWAETWAHFLHIIDTLETAYAFGLKVQPGIAEDYAGIQAEMNTDPHTIENFTQIMSQWLPLSFAMNSLNRSMGLNDPYPFVIRPVVMKKLGFIHQVCLLSRQQKAVPEFVKIPVS